MGVICFPVGVQPPQPPANFYPGNMLELRNATKVLQAEENRTGKIVGRAIDRLSLVIHQPVTGYPSAFYCTLNTHYRIVCQVNLREMNARESSQCMSDSSAFARGQLLIVEGRPLQAPASELQRIKTFTQLNDYADWKAKTLQMYAGNISHKGNKKYII